ncbi:hypothetical protein F66182_8045 [Fusarium sp. NRRL 66182]|nr:hypothetical protein F66182_8045 [Fusarium sp. NRRL 66182]
MVSFSALLICLAAVASAYPPTLTSTSVAKRQALINSHKLETHSKYITYIEGQRVKSILKRAETPDIDYVQIATLKLREMAPDATFRLIDDHYIGTNGVAHVNFQQVVDGIDVENANFNVNILKSGDILSHGDSFTPVTQSSELETKDVQIQPLAAFRAAVRLLQLPITGAANARIETTSSGYKVQGVEGTLEEPTVKLAYVHKASQLVLAWRVEVDIESNLLVTYVDATTGAAVIGVVDYTSAATYEAHPLGILNPNEGSRQVLVDPHDISASPLGWHNDGSQSYTTLRGNNVIFDPKHSLPSSASLVFSYPYSSSDLTTSLNASLAQGFYTLNRFHDILYALGFNEAAGNFQTSNNGKGGRGNDPIRLEIRTNTPGTITKTSDGISPHLRMGVSAGRDGIFDATILLHEYMHAVSTRLIGGGATAGCFSGNDGLSLDEGYSDAVPTLLRVKMTDTRETRYTIGEWFTGTPLGLRSHYITTNQQTSPLTFATLNTLTGGGFDLATVWAIALHEVFWNLADVHGIGEVGSVSLDANGVPRGARYLLLKLVLDSEALMPCRPHHLQARDALVQADQVLTGGANRCAIWKGFAKRGFGTNAVRGSGISSRVNGFAVPQGC